MLVNIKAPTHLTNGSDADCRESSPAARRS